MYIVLNKSLNMVYFNKNESYKDVIVNTGPIHVN